MGNNLLFIDLETYYSKDYDLRKLSIPEFVRDERFKLHGLAINGMWRNHPIEFKIGGWNTLTIVAHNAKFDGFVLAERYGIYAKSYVDTKALARAVLGRKIEGYSLKEVASYLGLVPKGEMKTIGKRDLTPDEEKELAEYCLHDVELCRQIYERLIGDFPENQLALMGQTIKMFINPQLTLNVDLLEKTAKEEKEKKEKLFFDLQIPKEKFSSNQQFAELLKEKGYVVPTKKSPRTEKPIPALALGDPEFLDLQETDDPALKKLIEARIAAKSTLMETRCDNLSRIGKTGLWPFDVEFSGAAQTHRYSGGGSSGGNPQNFTRDSALREAVQAPQGKSLVVGDFANIEMRLVAYLSSDPGLIGAIENGEDIYCKFASAFFGRRITKADENERRFGKTAILGLGYGMGPTKFQKTVRLQTGQKITIEEARKAVRLYRGLYSKVPSLWTRLDNLIAHLFERSSEQTVVGLPIVLLPGNSFRLPSGLKVQYPGLYKDGKEWTYEAWGNKGQKKKTEFYGGKFLENICQALAGELCKQAMIKFGDKVVGQVHDEILLVTDDPVTDRAELQTAMETSPEWLPNIRLEAEVGYGKSWLSAKHNV